MNYQFLIRLFTQTYLETSMRESANINDKEDQLKNANSLIGSELEMLLQVQLNLGFYLIRVEMYNKFWRIKFTESHHCRKEN
jgi:hypothetical protein